MEKKIHHFRKCLSFFLSHLNSFIFYSWKSTGRFPCTARIPPTGGALLRARPPAVEQTGCLQQQWGQTEADRKTRFFDSGLIPHGSRVRTDPGRVPEAINGLCAGFGCAGLCGSGAVSLEKSLFFFRTETRLLPGLLQRWVTSRDFFWLNVIFNKVKKLLISQTDADYNKQTKNR